MLLAVGRFNAFSKFDWKKGDRPQVLTDASREGPSELTSTPSGDSGAKDNVNKIIMHKIDLIAPRLSSVKSK